MGKLELSEKERGRLKILREIAVGRMTIRKGGGGAGRGLSAAARCGIAIQGTRSGGAAAWASRSAVEPCGVEEEAGADPEALSIKIRRLGPTLAQEYPEREEGEQVGVETIRR